LQRSIVRQQIFNLVMRQTRIGRMLGRKSIKEMRGACRPMVWDAGGLSNASLPCRPVGVISQMIMLIIVALPGGTSSRRNNSPRSHDACFLNAAATKKHRPCLHAE
jgi:hypothetical protein